MATPLFDALCEFSQACGGFVSPQERDAGMINQTDERPVLGG